MFDDRAYVELIVDGIHLAAPHLELTLRLKPKDKILLVYDAIRAKYISDGEYELGGQQVQVIGNRAQLADGTLAGSVLKMNDAMRNMCQLAACEMRDVIQFACENSAKQLGIFEQ